jgi:hypothetical protein
LTSADTAGLRGVAGALLGAGESPEGVKSESMWTSHVNVRLEFIVQLTESVMDAPPLRVAFPSAPAGAELRLFGVRFYVVVSAARIELSRCALPMLCRKSLQDGRSRGLQIARTVPKAER